MIRRGKTYVAAPNPPGLSEPKNERLPKIFSESAVTLAAFSGLLYVAGYVHKLILMHELGLHPNSISEPVQDVMTQGFICLFVSIPLYIILPPLAVIFTILAVYAKFGHTPKGGYINLIKSILRRYYSKSLNPFKIVFDMLFLGFVGGILAAAIDLATLSYAVRDDCKYCTVYTTDSGSIKGYVVISDASKLVIMDSKSSHLIAIDKLRSISRSNPNAEPISLGALLSE